MPITSGFIAVVIPFRDDLIKKPQNRLIKDTDTISINIETE